MLAGNFPFHISPTSSLTMCTEREQNALKELHSTIKSHKLDGWKARLNGRLQRAAAHTIYKTKTIELSAAYLARDSTTDSLITDMILHEIAHALTPGDGHGDLWRDMFRNLTGGKTPRLHAMNKRTHYCRECGATSSSGKKLRKCPKCKESFPKKAK